MVGREVEAAAALGEIGPVPVGLLLPCLRSRNNLVRDSAIRALTRTGEPAVGPLIGVLDSVSYLERSGAALSLGYIGAKEAVEPLIKALRDPNVTMRISVSKALGSLGDTRAVEPLIEALKRSDVESRTAAAAALGEIGDARALGPLKEYVEKEEDEKSRAVGERVIKRLSSFS